MQRGVQVNCQRQQGGCGCKRTQWRGSWRTLVTALLQRVRRACFARHRKGKCGAHNGRRERREKSSHHCVVECIRGLERALAYHGIAASARPIRAKWLHAQPRRRHAGCQLSPPPTPTRWL
jgi:hypothetical protein